MKPSSPSVPEKSPWTEAIKRTIGKDFAGRNVVVFPDDFFIVSYPRSGSTWLRFLIGSLIRKGPITFQNIEQVIPDIHVNSSRFLAGIPRPRLMKSHEYFDHRYANVLYLVRDPRDVALSYYRYYLKIRRFPDGYPMDQYIRAFLSGELQSWGSWAQNVVSWIAVRGNDPRFLVLRYEDLRESPFRELARVAAFLDLKYSTNQLLAAIELCSAERMRRLETIQGLEWITIRGSRSDVPFIGSATSGLWKTKLSLDCLRAIESRWGDLMARLGYQPVTTHDINHSHQNRQPSLGALADWVPFRTGA